MYISELEAVPLGNGEGHHRDKNACLRRSFGKRTKFPTRSGPACQSISLKLSLEETRAPQNRKCKVQNLMDKYRTTRIPLLS